MEERKNTIRVSKEQYGSVLEYIESLYNGGKTCFYADLLSLYPVAVYILPLIEGYAKAPQPEGLGNPSIIECIVHDDRSEEAERLATQILLETN